MPEDASLDDFLPGGGADGDPDDGTRESDDPGGEDPDVQDPDDEAPDRESPGRDAATGNAASEDGAAAGVEPASPTSRWAPDGDGCEACGATAGRLWRDGDRFVCADCKSWAGD